VRIAKFDPPTEAGRLGAVREIITAATRLDDPGLPPPSPGQVNGWWSGGYDGSPRQAWLATDDNGTPVGCYLLVLPERENPDRASCSLTVAPAHRRSGAGTALLAHCADQARLAGRSRLAGEAKDDSAGSAFAAAAGAQRGIGEVIRVLRIDADLPARLKALGEEARERAAGYSTLSWRGPIPDDLMADVVQVNAAMADAPHDEGVEPMRWDADRLRNMERVSALNGQQFHSVAARHDATGRLVAITQLATEPVVADWGYQQLTAVLPAHRGHRLGLLIKVAMLEQLAGWAPGVRSIITGNADANSYMISINVALGFEVASVYRDWTLDLTVS
jgi:GNAT superfamily N-acetyltransferase